MKELNWKFDKSLTHVKTIRKIVNPNFGFRKKLKKFELDLGLIDDSEYLKFIRRSDDLIIK